MSPINVSRTVLGRRAWAMVLGALLLAPLCSPVMAGVGSHSQKERQAQGAKVLPASARALGYSLYDMARAVASFNVGDRSGTPPNTPFQILYYNALTGNTDFRVGQGRYLYVPVMYNDTSLPVIGNFPGNAENHRQLVKYWYSQNEFGTVLTEIVVNGKVTRLGADYLSGVSFSTPLPDGATQYGTPAAFISPLSPGSHTVEIRFKATGDALRQDPVAVYFPDGVFEFSTTYTVTVY